MAPNQHEVHGDLDQMSHSHPQVAQKSSTAAQQPQDCPPQFQDHGRGSEDQHALPPSPPVSSRTSSSIGPSPAKRPRIKSNLPNSNLRRQTHPGGHEKLTPANESLNPHMRSETASNATLHCSVQTALRPSSGLGPTSDVIDLTSDNSDDTNANTSTNSNVATVNSGPTPTSDVVPHVSVNPGPASTSYAAVQTLATLESGVTSVKSRLANLTSDVTNANSSTSATEANARRRARTDMYKTRRGQLADAHKHVAPSVSGFGPTASIPGPSRFNQNRNTREHHHSNPTTGLPPPYHDRAHHGNHHSPPTSGPSAYNHHPATHGYHLPPLNPPPNDDLSVHSYRHSHPLRSSGPPPSNHDSAIYAYGPPSPLPGTPAPNHSPMAHRYQSTSFMPGPTLFNTGLVNPNYHCHTDHSSRTPLIIHPETSSHRSLNQYRRPSFIHGHSYSESARNEVSAQELPAIFTREEPVSFTQVNESWLVLRKPGNLLFASKGRTPTGNA
jgi:hypothetical protein